MHFVCFNKCWKAYCARKTNSVSYNVRENEIARRDAIPKWRNKAMIKLIFWLNQFPECVFDHFNESHLVQLISCGMLKSEYNERVCHIVVWMEAVAYYISVGFWLWGEKPHFLSDDCRLISSKIITIQFNVCHQFIRLSAGNLRGDQVKSENSMKNKKI